MTLTQFISENGGFPYAAKPRFANEVDHVALARLYNDWRNHA